MDTITMDYVKSLAPNPGAINNAKGLIAKKRYSSVYQSNDGTVLFGDCKGSSGELYKVSADFADPGNPDCRCSCPSRQRPCKHVLGLMYMFASGTSFPVADLPQSIMEARRKATKKKETAPKEEKKKPAAQPKKTNRSALEKKMKLQLEGLDLLEKVLCDTLKAGLGSLDGAALKNLGEQKKRLGDYYLSGPQTSLGQFIYLLERSDREPIYSTALDQLVTMYALCRKGREYLNKRLADPTMPMDKTTNIEELLGHVWQSAELKELGLASNGEELAQLCFNSYSSEPRASFVDWGIWASLKNKKLYQTFNVRPFKAAKHLKAEDTFFTAAQIDELFVYPGTECPRVRWETAATRDISSGDLEVIRSMAYTDFGEAVKAVRNQIKSPMADKHPCLLLHYARIGKVEEQWVMEDAKGGRLAIGDIAILEDMIPTCHLLQLLKSEYLKDQVALVRFHHDLDSCRLSIQLMSIVTSDKIIRLIY